MPGTPMWYQRPAFLLCIFPVGVMAELLTLESGSMCPAVFLYAAHKMYFVSEAGVLTILCAWALAAILYMRAKRNAKHL